MSLKSTFEWTNYNIIDREFRYTATHNGLQNQYIEIESIEDIPNNSESHPLFSILQKAPNNYIGIKGSVLIVYKWSAELDNEMQTVADNLDQFKLLLGAGEYRNNFTLDFENRIMYCTMDTNDRPIGEWLEEGTLETWAIRLPQRIQALEDGLVLLCILNKDTFSWKKKTYRLQPNESIEFNINPNAVLTYLIPCENSILINDSISINSYEAVQLVNESYIIKNENNTEVVLVVKEKF